MGTQRNLEELLAAANGRLKAAGAKVAIAKKKNSLFLRATLPPKPGSAKVKPHSQWVTLGVYFNPAGIKKAELKANELNQDLFFERFDWAKWGKEAAKTPKTKTVGDWLAEMEKDYFNRRGRNPKSETTWDKDYRLPLLRLPQHRVLTSELLVETVLELWEPNTRSRQRGCTAFSKLARLAGLDVNLTQYRGSYSPKAVNARNLPSDERIVELWESEDNPGWKNAIALLATYGLRPHEIFYVEMDTTLKEPPGVCTILDGKTGWRQIWPYQPEWWQQFGLHKSLELPNLTAKKNQEYGIRIAQWFKRHDYGMLPYDLRHAWAVRTAVAGLDPAIAAKMMGHDLSVHTRVYHQFINRASLQAAWERSQKLGQP